MNKLQEQVPEFKILEFFEKKTTYCLCIPVINEGERIVKQLEKIRYSGIDRLVDVIICDGGSSDGSVEPNRLKLLGVNTLLTKIGPGKLGAQLRMGYYWALNRGYSGIITVDGNGKDDPGSIPEFINKLDAGYDMIQGSRYLPGGGAINTPWVREVAVKLIHIPLISFVAGFPYTDTTNGFRGYSRKYLTHPEVRIFRDIFVTYELLAYLSVRAPQLGLRTIEIPVIRAYPEKGGVPTKISIVKGNLKLIRILINIILRKYDPDRRKKTQ